jgi:hypothetical protein
VLLGKTPTKKAEDYMSWLTDLLKEYPAVAVVKERLEHELKLHEETKAKNVELLLQVDELAKAVATLRRELAEKSSVEEYDQRGGLLWKKNGEGPFCPKCKGTMGRFGSRRRCPICGIAA